MLKVFERFARLKRLRGTPYDVFGYSAERRLERRLIAEYEAMIQRVLAEAGVDNHATAVELASLPEHIRGYGHVEAEHLAKVRTREAELLAQLRPGQARPAAA